MLFSEGTVQTVCTILKFKSKAHYTPCVLKCLALNVLTPDSVNQDILKGEMICAAGSNAASQIQGLCFEPELRLLPVWGFMSFSCLHGFPPGSQVFFPPPKSMSVFRLAR